MEGVRRGASNRPAKDSDDWRSKAWEALPNRRKLAGRGSRSADLEIPACQAGISIMLPLPTRFSQVFLDTFSLQGCLQPVRFASLLHIRTLSLTNRIPETINAAPISLEWLVLP
jgi:hypothetical protein